MAMCYKALANHNIMALICIVASLILSPICIYICLCMYVCMHVCMYVCVCMHMYVSICIYSHVYVFGCVFLCSMNAYRDVRVTCNMYIHRNLYSFITAKA